MTQGLYEILGADRSADHTALHQAYTRSVAAIARRRRALVEQGGDTRMIDLGRAQLDEAWVILADPARRRRYDALLALTEEGEIPSASALWERVAGALTSPAAAAAVDLLRGLTRLDLGIVPVSPGAPSPPVEDEPTWTPDTQAEVPTESFDPDLPVARSDRDFRRDAWNPPAAPVLGVARPPAAAPAPPVSPVPLEIRAEPRVELRVVEGRSGGAPVIRLPVDPARQPDPPSQPAPVPRFLVEEAVTELGWTGALLRRVREERGLSLKELGEATRITARYLEAIEGDDFEHLPSSTFVKGYLREMARVLELDEVALVKGYMRRMS